MPLGLALQERSEGYQIEGAGSIFWLYFKPGIFLVYDLILKFWDRKRRIWTKPPFSGKLNDVVCIHSVHLSRSKCLLIDRSYSRFFFFSISSFIAFFFIFTSSSNLYACTLSQSQSPPCRWKPHCGMCGRMYLDAAWSVCTVLYQCHWLFE